MHRKRGSITVFLALSLAGVMLITFLLLDMARLKGQRQKAETISDIAIMSVFADYNRYLWDNYSILAVDASYGTGGGADFAVMESRMGEYLLKNGTSPDTYGTDLYRLNTEKCEVVKYGLLTDQNGRAFLKQAALQQKYELPEQALDRLVDRNDQVTDDAGKNDTVDDLLQAGNDALKESEDLKKQASSGKKADRTAVSGDSVVRAVPLSAVVVDKKKTQGEVDLKGAKKAEDVENPMDDVTDWMNDSILSQVLPKSARISSQRIDLSNAVSRRTLAQGNNGSIESLNAAEKALFADYEKTHFSCYRNDLGHDGLKYEWEYVLCGKDSDKKNLTATVTRLLGLREAENMVSLLSDSSKVAQAEALAASIAGWTANPAIVEAVKWGLIASWAYTESVLDVRLLLSGGKVSLVKTASEWTTTNLLELASFFDVNKKAKECGYGITYEGYLLTMSALQTDKTLGLRGLDILENSLKLHEHYENSAMDQMVVSASIDYSFSSAPAFFSLFALSSETFPVLGIDTHREMSYLDRAD